MIVTYLTIILLFASFTAIESERVLNHSVTDISGEEIDLQQFEGNVLLVVNTASRCGFTPQYSALQSLYEQYADNGFYVLGFPSNQFNQELETDEKVMEFCDLNFNVTFPMFSITPVGGDNAHPFFEQLTRQQGFDPGGDIRWNFEKFLIGKDGKLHYRFGSRTNPADEDVVEAIEQLLRS